MTAREFPNVSRSWRSRSIGVGIGGIGQRVKEFGGVLRLTNTNPGTCVEVTIPFSIEAEGKTDIGDA